MKTASEEEEIVICKSFRKCQPLKSKIMNVPLLSLRMSQVSWNLLQSICSVCLNSQDQLSEPKKKNTLVPSSGCLVS